MLFKAFSFSTSRSSLHVCKGPVGCGTASDNPTHQFREVYFSVEERWFVSHDCLRTADTGKRNNKKTPFIVTWPSDAVASLRTARQLFIATSKNVLSCFCRFCSFYHTLRDIKSVQAKLTAGICSHFDVSEARSRRVNRFENVEAGNVEWARFSQDWQAYCVR